MEEDLKFSHGLVENLQHDVNKREHKTMKLTIAFEKSKLDCQEAYEQLHAMSNKFANLKEEKKHEKVVAMMEKELQQVWFAIIYPNLSLNYRLERESLSDISGV